MSLEWIIRRYWLSMDPYDAEKLYLSPGRQQVPCNSFDCWKLVFDASKLQVTRRTLTVRRQRGDWILNWRKTAFLRPPKLRKFLERIFGQILVKKYFYHITLLGPPDLSKKGPFCKKQRFLHLPKVSCGFTSIKCVFLVRKVSFRLLLVLETLDQPKLAVWNQNFLSSLTMISERSTSVCKIFDVTHKKQVSRYRCSCTTRVKFWY